MNKSAARSVTYFAAICCINNTALSQQYIDNYLSQQPVYTTIGTSADGVSQPTDLDFKPNTNELWVINYGDNSGGSSVTFFNAGETTQTSQYRKDSHAGHFMMYPTALAFSETGEWGSTSDIKNTANPSSTFMGPALWSGDTNIHARVFQNNWQAGFPLGSHTDMLHQSPFSMGIAHEAQKMYWVADGWNGNVCKYDFGADHGPGYDDHSDGKIWRYTDIQISRVAGIPGHMVLDKDSQWLYFVNAGTKQVLRMNTGTGTVAGNLVAPNEYLASYQSVTGATKEVIATYNSQPSGIDYYNNRLVVGDYQTGEIRIYNTAATTPTLMGTLSTGHIGMTGLKIGSDGKIWFVNKSQDKVVRIDISPVSNDAAVSRIIEPKVGSSSHSPQFNLCSDVLTPVVEITNEGSNQLTSMNIVYTTNGGSSFVTFNWTGSLAAGASTTVSLISSLVSGDEYELVVHTSAPNGGTDNNPANDAKGGLFRNKDIVASLPFFESFSANTFPPAGWSYLGYNRFCEMSREATQGSFGTNDGCMKMDNSSGEVNISGQIDYLISPRIDLTQSGPGSNITFDVAYAQYSSSSNDRLEVLVSDDCGESWTSVYDRSGNALSTASPTTSVFQPEFYQWRTDDAALDAFLGKEILFMFKTTSDYGNNLYIDQINIGYIPSGLAQSQLEEAVVFPNPTSGKVQVKLPGNGSGQIEVMDLFGRKITDRVKTGKTGDEILFDFSNEAAGTYFISIASGSGTTVKKILVQR